MLEFLESSHSVETSKIPKVSLTSRGNTANPSSLAAIDDFYGNALSEYLKNECNSGSG